MLSKEEVTIYRKTCSELLWKYRSLLIASYPSKRISDKDVASYLDLSPTAFSLALSGASSLSGPSLYRLMIYLWSFGVDVADFVRSHDLYYSGHLDQLLSFEFDKCSPNEVCESSVSDNEDLS